MGSTITYTLVANISSGASGNLVNTATVTPPAGVTDANPGNNSATDSDTLTAQVTLAVVKTDGSATYTPGGTATLHGDRHRHRGQRRGQRHRHRSAAARA